MGAIIWTNQNNLCCANNVRYVRFEKAFVETRTSKAHVRIRLASPCRTHSLPPLTRLNHHLPDALGVRAATPPIGALERAPNARPTGTWDLYATAALVTPIGWRSLHRH